MPALTLLGAVRWRGTPVVGERARSLLAALVCDAGEQSSERLVERVWGDDRPAHPAKALQVLVSRVRSACGPDTVASTARGYRLGLGPDDVDVLLLRDLADAARRAHAEGRSAEAVRFATDALALGEPADDGAPGPLADLRRVATTARETAGRVTALATSDVGDHAAALPDLERLAREDPDDEEVLERLLRSEVEVRGPAAALERYEHHREQVRDRLGTDPGERLRAVHRELLARDAPVRSGLVFEADDLVGRDADVRDLRGLIGRARVVSIIGPGGLGKTRLAQLLARTAQQPVVHVVELVGIASADDVVGEVGSALGVRESVAGRRALTPEQRADVRSRIAQQLTSAPSLLVLDNCEHVVDAVADLVAFLVATTRDARVLITSRAPLGIAAEHVYALGTLSATDATDLFHRRAIAARPSATLGDATVTALVERLDGLPLAIELAAARVRAMTVEDILGRLDDRFALLRGGDRSAPDRHRTLQAVIDWSWGLLGEAERDALARLSVFHDGFTLDAADAVLRDGGDALDVLTSLADQSLLDVRDVDGAVRYRMLETIREFGRLRLAEGGREADALDAQRTWAIGVVGRARPTMAGPDEVETLRRVGAEEANLGDVLRRALADGDPVAVVELLSVLVPYWTVIGYHHRAVTMGQAVSDVLDDFDPPGEIADLTREVIATIGSNAMVFGRRLSVLDTLQRLGPGGASPRGRALVRLVLLADGTPLDAAALDGLASDDDRHVASIALMLLAHQRENDGDVEGGIEATERALALWRPEDGPTLWASMSAQLAALWMQVGNPDRAEEHAVAALPGLRATAATDDVVQTESLLTLVDMHHGRLDEAEARLRGIELEDNGQSFGGGVVAFTGWAELAIARGDLAEGARLYDEAVRVLGSRGFPGFTTRGYEPWLLVVEGAALSAHAAVDAGSPRARELAASVRHKAAEVTSGRVGRMDFPIVGMMLFALAHWHLRHGTDAVLVARALALAEGFGFNRAVPSMATHVVADPLDQRDPGVLAAERAKVGTRRGPDLRDEVLVLLDAL